MHRVTPTNMLISKMDKEKDKGQAMSSFSQPMKSPGMISDEVTGSFVEMPLAAAAPTIVAARGWVEHRSILAANESMASRVPDLGSMCTTCNPQGFSFGPRTYGNEVHSPNPFLSTQQANQRT
jgi:hypothetical protein